MSSSAIVRYRTSPDAADENAPLVVEVQPAPTAATFVGSFGHGS